MTLDIRARDFLSRIKESHKDAEKSIIAGGATRDSIFGKASETYDFFVPYEGYFQSQKVLIPITKLSKQIAPYRYDRKIVDSYSGVYEGLKFSVRAFFYQEDDLSFAESVMETFDWGINRCWYEDNTGIKESPEFDYDRQHGMLTLLKLKSIEHLSEIMLRFNKINEKIGPGFIFRSPLLELKKEKKDSKIELPIGQKLWMPIPVPERFNLNIQNVDWEAVAQVNNNNNENEDEIRRF